MNNKGAWSFGSRCGLLAYVYSGVSLTTDVLNECLSGGNGSYMVRPCGHDLHGPTVIFTTCKEIHLAVFLFVKIIIYQP